MTKEESLILLATIIGSYLSVSFIVFIAKTIRMQYKFIAKSEGLEIDHWFLESYGGWDHYGTKDKYEREMWNMIMAIHVIVFCYTVIHAIIKGIRYSITHPVENHLKNMVLKRKEDSLAKIDLANRYQAKIEIEEKVKIK